MADMRRAIGRLGALLKSIIEEKGLRVLAEAEMRRTKERPRADVGGLKLRVKVLERQCNRCIGANATTAT